MNDLTSEWLISKGFIQIRTPHASCTNWVWFKGDICIEADYDGWFIMSESNLNSLEETGYNLGTKPRREYQVELLYEAVNGIKLI